MIPLYLVLCTVLYTRAFTFPVSTYSQTLSYGGTDGTSWVDDLLPTNMRLCMLKLNATPNSNLRGLQLCYRNVTEEGTWDVTSYPICTPTHCGNCPSGRWDNISLSAEDYISKIVVRTSTTTVSYLRVETRFGQILEAGTGTTSDFYYSWSGMIVGTYGKTSATDVTNLGFIMRVTPCANGVRISPNFCNCTNGYTGYYCDSTNPSDASYSLSSYQHGSPTGEPFQDNNIGPMYRLSAVKLQSQSGSMVRGVQFCYKRITPVGVWDNTVSEVCHPSRGCQGTNLCNAIGWRTLTLANDEYINTIQTWSNNNSITYMIITTNKGGYLDAGVPNTGTRNPDMCSATNDIYRDSEVIGGYGTYSQNIDSFGVVLRTTPCLNGGSRTNPISCNCINGTSGFYCQILPLATSTTASESTTDMSTTEVSTSDVVATSSATSTLVTTSIGSSTNAATSTSSEPSITSTLPASTTGPSDLTATSNTTNTSLVPIIVGIVVPSVVIIVALLVYIILSNRRSRKHQQESLELMMTNSYNSSTSSISSGSYGFNRNSISITPRSSIHIKDTESPYTQLLVDIKIQRKLGGGNFGEVYKGLWQETTEVAMKKLKSETIEDFKKEVNTLRSLNHPNIVRFYGVHLAMDDAVYIVTELLPKGNALDVIRSEQLNDIDLIAIAMDTAAGMKHLQEAGIVHADLALRNVLLAARPDGKAKYIAKVSDFGLSKSLYGSSYYKTETTENTVLPIRWSPIEVIRYGKFSYASDVYSYGVLLYELYSGGLIPFYGTPNNKVAELIVNGQKLPHEERCPEEIHKLLLNCCSEVPDARPNFDEIYDFFHARFLERDSELHPYVVVQVTQSKSNEMSPITDKV